MNYEGKYVLVTGGTGMIGTSLTNYLVNKGARVTVASLDKDAKISKKAVHIIIDLTKFDNCMTVCDGMDYVFHLAGIKGSPKMCKEQPASFFVPTMMFNTNMMEAARRRNVKRFLYTSSMGVYSPAEEFKEDDVWKTFPSEHDRFAGWAKRMGELQTEAYRIQYKTDMFRIVRPANVYGPNDNFDPNNAMVIPSLVARVAAG
jgi:GDP-L-fucose synthase